MATVYLLIEGKVQGVFYRASAKEEANRLGITGWVKNTEQGHVEAVASGYPEALEQFINWCRKGPAKAVVTAVAIKELKEEVFQEFSVKRDLF